MNRFSGISLSFHILLLLALILFTEQVQEPIKKREPLIVERILLQKESPTPPTKVALSIEPEPEIAIIEPKPETEPEREPETEPLPPKIEELPPPPPQKKEKKVVPPPKPIKPNKPKKVCTPPPKASPKKESPKKKDPPKKEAPKTDPKKDLALQKARDALKKATETMGDTTPIKKESAKQIAQLSSEAAPKEIQKGSVGEVSYREELARRLQLKIVLPESGFVEIKLTINRQGQFKKVEIVKGSKPQNRQAVEKLVPTLTFPPFGGHFPGEESHTFLIMLTSD